MKQKNPYSHKKKGGWLTDPGIEEALSNLKSLANSPGDRCKVRREVVALRQKGVPVQVLADHSQVCPGTIWRWQKESLSSNRQSVVLKSKSNPNPSRPPLLRVLDVVQAEPDQRSLPKINLRAEWARIRLNFELF